MEDQMICPYLRCGKARVWCVAYLGEAMTPSIFEEEHYCRTHLHQECVWLRTKQKEVVIEAEAGVRVPPDGALQGLAVI
jgi:hypothetical protein